MTRTRLRPTHTHDRLMGLYPHPHRHDLYGADHAVRVGQSGALARWAAKAGGCQTGADLSCGDAAIIRASGVKNLILGDLAAGWEHRGPIEKTLGKIPPVDLFVCCETLEHLDNPDHVLSLIRDKASRLVCSLPLTVDPPDTNEEHYWQYTDPADGEAMLTAAGWTVDARVDVTGPGWPYTFMVWACS